MTPTTDNRSSDQSYKTARHATAALATLASLVASGRVSALGVLAALVAAALSARVIALSFHSCARSDPFPIFVNDTYSTTGTTRGHSSKAHRSLGGHGDWPPAGRAAPRWRPQRLAAIGAQERPPN